MGNDLGSLLGGMLGGEQGGKGGALLGALLSSLGGAGTHGGGSNPLGALLDTLKEGGLGAQTDSWIGRGRNQAVSGPEVAQALPYQALDHVARRRAFLPRKPRTSSPRPCPRPSTGSPPTAPCPRARWRT